MGLDARGCLSLRGTSLPSAERYFLAEVPAFEPRPQVIGSEEAKTFDGLRWWTLEELQATSERFAPTDFPRW